MKDKHLHVPEDDQLLKLIYNSVSSQSIMDKKTIIQLIWLKFIFYTSLTLFSYWAIFQIEDPHIFVLCFILYGIVSILFAFNFSHDFSHNTIFKSKKWNNLCFIAIYTLVGAHAEAWKQRHIHSHHYAPNVEEYDSDLQISSLIRVIPNSEYKWYHRIQHLYAPIAYCFYSLYWIFIKDWVILIGKDEYQHSKGFRYCLSFAVQKLVYLSYILVLPAMYSKQTFFTVLIAFVLMHFVQSIFLLFTFFITHHVEETFYPTTDKGGVINSSWVMNQIRSSNDFYPFSETANFIFGGFNNHIAHHLFSHIHHIHYPRINRILYQILIEKHICPNRTTYMGGICSHFRLLKKMAVNG